MRADDNFISMHRKLIRGAIARTLASAIVGILFFTLGCVKLSGSLKKIGVNDFARTQFVVSGGAPADGVTGLLVGLQLKNSDNSSVADYTPVYEVVSGQSVPVSTCTTSDKNGISACILRSTVPGTKTIALTNAKVGLKQDLVFTAPGNAKVLNTVSAASVNVPTTGGSKVSLSLGEPNQGLARATQGGYKVLFTTVGAGVTQ